MKSVAMPTGMLLSRPHRICTAVHLMRTPRMTAATRGCMAAACMRCPRKAHVLRTWKCREGGGPHSCVPALIALEWRMALQLKWRWSETATAR